MADELLGQVHEGTAGVDHTVDLGESLDVAGPVRLIERNDDLGGGSRVGLGELHEIVPRRQPDSHTLDHTLRRQDVAGRQLRSGSTLTR